MRNKKLQDQAFQDFLQLLNQPSLESFEAYWQQQFESRLEQLSMLNPLLGHAVVWQER